MDIKRITNKPKHHLFGFHDLICTNTTSEKCLANEADVINRPPLPGEKFGVGYIENNIYVRVGETEALNYPQGSRLQWIDNNSFCVNNRVDNQWGTDIYDATTNKLIDRLPQSTHFLSRDSKLSYGLDYARLHRLGGYGYVGIEDELKYDAAPTHSGITIQNLETKKSDLLVSVKEVANCGMNFNPNGPHHYLTHLCVNPSGHRIAFLHRFFMPDGGLMTRLMTIGADGTNLRCIAKGFLSHFDWLDNDNIYIYGRANNGLDSLRSNPILGSPLLKSPVKIAKKIIKALIGRSKSATAGKSFILITDKDHPIIKPFGEGIITEDGHPMTNPINRQWCSNDTYPNDAGIRDLMLYNITEKFRINLGKFRMLDAKPDMSLHKKYLHGIDSSILKIVKPELLCFTRSGLHCDLHPRWSADGTTLYFDSIHEGSRQIYAVNVSEIVMANNE